MTDICGRVALFPVQDPNSGGVYQYSLLLSNAMRRLASEGFVRAIAVGGDLQPSGGAQSPRIHESLGTFDRIPSVRVGRGIAVADRAYRGAAKRWRALVTQQSDAEQSSAELRPSRLPSADLLRWRLARRGVSLTLHIVPSQDAIDLRIPFVVPIHDVQHRLRSHDPEFQHGVFEARERVYLAIARRAAVLLVDSEIGREDVLECYGSVGLQPERVHVQPLLPPSYLGPSPSKAEAQRVRLKYGLPEEYLFYPAQFWPHKRHVTLIHALAILKRSEGMEIGLVLSGSAVGALRHEALLEVRETAQRLGVTDLVHLIGYAPHVDMNGLYSGARALVMPTLYGPTNIPILEAWTMRCPVITSDIRGCRDQVGEAGLTANPEDAEEWAVQVARVLRSDSLATELTARGSERIASYTEADFAQGLLHALHSASAYTGEPQVRSVRST